MTTRFGCSASNASSDRGIDGPMSTGPAPVRTLNGPSAPIRNSSRPSRTSPTTSASLRIEAGRGLATRPCSMYRTARTLTSARSANSCWVNPARTR
nr:hypothetical protein [Kibdelosporangium phytohabitans]